MAKKVLGKGLGALLASPETDINEGDIIQIPINKIEPNPLQPRKLFDKEKLDELANSIKEKGLIQPIVVSQKHESYEIIVGERRWRASQLVGLQSIPAIVKDASNYEKLELALIENIQRQDLNSIEEATSYKELLESLNITQEQLSSKIGKSRTAIANTLRLLKLPEDIQIDITHERLTEGHGRSLLAIKDESSIHKVKDIIIRDNLSVRQTERLVQQVNEGSTTDLDSPDGLLITEKQPDGKDDSIFESVQQEQVDIPQVTPDKVDHQPMEAMTQEPQIISQETTDIKENDPPMTQDKPVTVENTMVNESILNMEKDLKVFFETEVHIKQSSSDSGKIEIKYHTTQELDRILQLLGVK